MDNRKLEVISFSVVHILTFSHAPLLPAFLVKDIPLFPYSTDSSICWRLSRNKTKSLSWSKFNFGASRDPLRSLNVCFSRPVPRPLTPDFHLTFPWFCLTFLLTTLLDEFLELLDASQWKYSPCLTQFYECLLLFFLNLASIIHYCLSSICLHSVAFLFFWFKRTSLNYLLCYLSHCSLEGGTITKLLIERKHLIGRG